MSIKEYLPPFLSDVREYNEICNIEDVELNQLKGKIEQLLDEVVINYASSYGLKRYEKIYNIVPSTKDIIERRFNVLSKMNNKAPYTLNWLRNKLETLVGKENYRINVDYNNYSIVIEVIMLFENIAKTLKNDLREQLPANMLITVNLFQNEKANLYVGAIVHEGEKILIKSEVQ